MNFRTTPWLVLAAMTVAALWSGLDARPAQAQETVELNKKQIEYFQKAGDFLKEDDFDRAIEYYQLALKQGEVNVLYAALGRAYFRKGECKNADDAYVKALSAPAVAQPTAQDVRQKVEEYRIGLKVDCKGTLELVCEPGDIEVRIGDGARRPCADFPIELAPDTYKLIAFSGGKSIDQEVKIVGLETTSVKLSIQPDAPVGPVGPVSTGEIDGTWATASYVTVGLGAAVLLTAVVLDATVLATAVDDFKAAADARSAEQDALLDDAEGLQTVVLASYLAGGALAITGVVLYLIAPDEMVDPAVNPEAPPAGARLQPWFGQDGAGVQLQLPW